MTDKAYYSIGMKMTKRQEGEERPEGESCFFGAPDLPEAWLENEFGEGELFLCQVRCADLAPYDPEGRLPHRGMLYLFLDITEEEYLPAVRYWDGEGPLCRVDFNEGMSERYELLQEYAVAFSSCQEEEDEEYGASGVGGCKWLGYPAQLPDFSLGSHFVQLFQYDPAAHPDWNFLADRDRMVYVVIQKEALAAHRFEETYAYTVPR